MAVRLRLEVFETEVSDVEPLFLGAEELEEIRAGAYEEGYTSGWDDAVKHSELSQNASSAALSQNLQLLTFTYTEARNHVLRAVQPLLRAMAESVLPELAKTTLAEMVLEQLMAIADPLHHSL
jgi:flagellar biosynthesis/type III secretory pathway protein FliH